MSRPVLILMAILGGLPALAQSIPLGEIVSDDRTIRDPLYGFTTRFPSTWTVRGVTRWGDNETTIYFGVPALGDSFPTLYYQIHSTPSAMPAAPEAFLREEARRRATRRVDNGLADYATVPDSFVFKTINGRPALAYLARYSAGGRTMCEYYVRVLSDKGVAQFLLRAPLEELDSVRGEFDGMVESVRLP
jgi:hypothetical protein